MKLSDYIVEMISEIGVEIVFGYTGGSVADIIDSICKSKSIKYVQVYNEQAAAFAANAYAQVTGKTGIAVASSGPGAINLINGIANAYYDSIPCVFITGNVHSLGKRENDKIRQNAFQETDIVEIVKPITKYSVYIKDGKDIEEQLQKAFYIANEGRKGPVLVDIPYDIQRTDINVHIIPEKQNEDDIELKIDINSFLEKLQNAKRPLILLGGGAQRAKKELNDMLKKVSIPVVASMRGIDIISHENPSYIGMIGSYGNMWANLAVYYCDLLIVLGSRLDERQMGYDKEVFAPNAKIVQVDIDVNELGRKTNNELSIHSSVEEFVSVFAANISNYSCEEWRILLRQWRDKYSKRVYQQEGVIANRVIKNISNYFDKDAVILADVGQNQIICAQSLMLREENIFLSSAGLACMGYSLPAAIGAYYASMKRQIISINGDGGIMMNVQELQTIKRERIPIKIIVLNNECLGLIRKLQENIFEEKYYASIEGYQAADFEKIAKAFDIDYLKLQKENDTRTMKAFLEKENSVMLEIKVPVKSNTLSEPGKKIYEQIPGLSDREFEELERQVEQI